MTYTHNNHRWEIWSGLKRLAADIAQKIRVFGIFVKITGDAVSFYISVFETLDVLRLVCTVSAVSDDKQDTLSFINNKSYLQIRKI